MCPKLASGGYNFVRAVSPLSWKTQPILVNECPSHTKKCTAYRRFEIAQQLHQVFPQSGAVKIGHSGGYARAVLLGLTDFFQSLVTPFIRVMANAVVKALLVDEKPHKENKHQSLGWSSTTCRGRQRGSRITNGQTGFKKWRKVSIVCH